MSRILAIDYGKKRTGIAVSDPTQIIANGLTTVPTSTLFDFVKQYMEQEEVERIVVGLPKKPNGEYSDSMASIEPFVNRLRKHFPTLPVEYYDERFTSVLAHQAIIDSGIGKKARQNKALVDQISATIILRDYMEWRRMQANFQQHQTDES